MARRTRSRAASRQGLARTRTHSATSEAAASRWGRSQYRRRLRLEALEDRRLLAGITVTTLADTVDFNDGVTSLREAIFAANTVPGPDTIEFAPALTANGPATILLTQAELKITDSLTINGPGAELLAIDVSGSDPTPDLNNRDGSRIFNTMPSTRPAPGEQLPSLHIEGLTLTGGDARNKGGAILSAGVLVLIDCRVIGNSSLIGGGVSLGINGYEPNHILGSKIVDSWFEDNVAADSGGGVWAYDNTLVESSGLEITNCTFVGNSAGGDGGGLYVDGFVATVVVNNSVFQVNTARNGGGAYTNFLSGLTLASSAVHDNVSREDGGGIYSAGPLHIRQSSIFNNSAQRVGGGIRASSNATIESSTISGNKVLTFGSWGAFGGGGIYSRGPLDVRNSTVTGNIASAAGAGGSYSIGGGIWALEATIDHSIIAGNTRGQLAKPDDHVGNLTMSNSLLGVHTGGIVTETGSNLIGTLEAPIDPLLGPLADNGGFELPDRSRILTHALLAGSPAINAGNLNAKVGDWSVSEFDQRGEPFGRIVGGRIDIGAFEYQTPTDLNLLVDTLVDESDGDYSRGDLSLREAIELANAANFEGVVDTIRFDPALWAAGPATILLTQGELKIADSLAIEGPGSELLTIDASGNDPTPEINDGLGSRVFSIDDGDLSKNIVVVIDAVGVTGGDAQASGGGILSRETLVLRRASVFDNAAGVTSASGGGVFNDSGNLSLFQSNVKNNSVRAARGSGAGGGIASMNGELSVTDSTISGNRSGVGGGTYSRGGALQINNSAIEENTASNGAGLYVRDSVTEIFGTVFHGNEAQSNGGGIYLRFDHQGKASIARSVISGNAATQSGFNGGGGGVYMKVNDHSLVAIERCAIMGNSTGRAGGGIRMSVHQNSVVSIRETTIASNSAANGGGAFAELVHGSNLIVQQATVSDNFGNGGGGVLLGGTLGSQATISYSTIVKNLVGTGGGGGIRTTGMGLEINLNHSIVAANQDLTGFPADIAHFGTGRLIANYCLVGSADHESGLTGSSANPGIGNVIGTTNDGEIPIDPLLGPLADNGGFVLPDGSRILTHALLAGSPAINAGDLNAVAGAGGVPEYDQRGEPFGRIVGGRMDIGAFEYQTPTDLKLLVDTLVDESDGDYSRGDLSLREAIELANAAKFAGVVDTIRFDPALWAAGPATILLTRGELKVTDSLTIDGPGAELLTIDASGNDPTPEVNNGDGSRVFNIDDGIFSSFLNGSIIGMALTGADTSSLQDGGAIFARAHLSILACRISGNAAIQHGGGIRVLFGELTMSESTIWGNSARVGGGISGTYVTVTDSEIFDNVATERGGGIRGGIVRVDRSTISGNTANSGGGIYGDRSVTVEGCTISNNSAIQDGGGIYSSGSVTVISSTVSDNRAGRAGGGIVTIGGVTVTNSTISGNTAEIYGGGIRASGNVMVTGSIFSGNSAGAGGGINGHSATISVVNSSFTGNSATYGGGILGENVTIVSSTISDNSAVNEGGGVLARSSVEVIGSVISDNSSNQDGGGIAAYGRVKVVGSTISGNTAVGRGGGIFTDRYSDIVDVWDSTISGNSASQGGGVWAGFANFRTLSMNRSTVTGNSAEVGGGLFWTVGELNLDHAIVADNWARIGPDFTGLMGVVVDARFSLIGDNRQSGLVEAPVGSPDANGNLIGGSAFATMIDPKLGPLADNGGPTMTHALLAGSPAINAGDPLAVAGVDGVPVHGQRGAPFTRVFGGRIDMGAVEAIPVGFLPGDFNGNGVVDAADYSEWRDTVGSVSDLRGDGNGDGKVDTLDYEVWKANFGAAGVEQGAGSRGQGDKAAPAQITKTVVGRAMVLPPAEPGAVGRDGIEVRLGNSEPQTRGMDRRVGRRATENFENRREGLLDAWWAKRGRVFEGLANVDAGCDGNKPVAVEAVDFAVVELGRLRLGVGE
jgi:CSLREA domain-containing protein